MTVELIITSVLLGVGLAMDAFSVSIANGLADRKMKTGRMLTIAGTFAGFQIAMPLIGWFLVRRAAEQFEWFRPLIPWIALVLLLIIGIELIKDGIEENRKKKTDTGSETANAAAINDPAMPACRCTEDGSEAAGAGKTLTAGALFVQGVATSIDALSVGFTIADYSTVRALLSSVIIGVVTFIICMAGLKMGRRLGSILGGRASILGGAILIAIGLEIWIKGVFF